jgi:sugar lactone lactonase YvrE
MRRMHGRAKAQALVAALVMCCVLGAVPGTEHARAAFGDARIFAPFPANPGSPEAIAVRRGKVYVSGGSPVFFPGEGPSTVIVYDRATGAMLRRYDGAGSSGMAFDRRGRLYVLGESGMGRLDLKTGAVERYGSRPPDLRPCVPLVVRPPCSPTPIDLSPSMNELVFAADGDAYFSDSLQATIWRIPSGGGAPRIWFQDSRLATAFVGVNGLRIDPSGRRMYMAVTLDLLGASLVYSLPLVAKPASRQLRVFHRLPVGDGPDGIAFGARGDLYVAIGSPHSSGVVILRPDGRQRARLRNPLGSLIAPYDGPADMAFDGKGRLLLTNHAFATELLRQFSIAEVDVGDRGAKLFTPAIP